MMPEELAIAGVLQYEAQIRGHEAPFKWTLIRIQPGGARAAVQIMQWMEEQGNNGGTYMVERMAEAKGEAPTYDEAVQAAREAAEVAENFRVWASVTNKEVVLEIPFYDDIPTTEEPT